ncbi:MAG: hypothetical protein VXY77_04405 [Pseudomonadota bacterium]|nr:hypothetical protein [Pseudomonadota bacterium]
MHAYRVPILALAAICTMKGQDNFNPFNYYYHNPPIYRAHQVLAKRTQLHPAEAFAIIKHESNFRAHASYRRHWLYDIFVKPKSSAYGYAQAIDASWHEYQKVNPSAKRSHYLDSIGFIHWYIHKHRSLFRNHSMTEHYKLYHDGPKNYQEQNLLVSEQVVRRVEQTYQQYKKEFDNRITSLDWRVEWHEF